MMEYTQWCGTVFVDEAQLRLAYASWGPIFWPFLRRSARAPKTEAVRGTVAIKGVSTIERAVRSSYGEGPFPLQGPSVPLTGPSVSLMGVFEVFILGLGLGPSIVRVSGCL